MIEARNLTKYYGYKRAIHDLAFRIEKGEVVGFLGLNGAGKSTTLRILSCLLLPSGGSVTIDGVNIVSEPERIRRQIGFLPETPPLYEEMTAKGFLEFAGRLRGMSRAHVLKRLPDVAAKTGLEPVLDELVGNLSHGFRKRVGIAQAIIHEPPLLILDEPISGLDPAQIVEMRELIKGLGGQHTVLVSSHILSEISQTCDRLLMIQDGEIIAQGAESDLISRFQKGHTINLLVRGEKENIEQDLGTFEFVHSVEAVEESAYRVIPGAHRFRVELEHDSRESLSRELIEKGHGLLEMSAAQAELESIFLKLTSHKTRETAAAAGGAA